MEKRIKDVAARENIKTIKTEKIIVKSNKSIKNRKCAAWSVK